MLEGELPHELESEAPQLIRIEVAFWEPGVTML